MNNIYLPLHVWDREFDSRLAIAYLEACKGNRSIIGHEYNISPCYEHDQNALLFRAGQPLDHSVRGKWHKDIKERGGIVITHDEEGINNMPFDFVEIGGRKIANLNLDKVNEFPHKGSPQAFKDVSMQMAWGDLHRAFQCHQISNLQSRTIALNRITSKSSVRFDLLGNFGDILNTRYVESIKNIYGNYILVLDNFSVDHRGQQGMVDPSQDLKQAGFSDKAIKKYVSDLADNGLVEARAREDFANLIKKIAKNNPFLNFVFRPHPVLDPKYWQEAFASSRNITIAERGPIHAWIYGAIATIHSGCTTGLEAYAADKATYDVSDLISKRSSSIKASLIGQSVKEIQSSQSLEKELKKLWIDKIKKSEILDRTRKERGGISKRFQTDRQDINNELHHALELIQANCNQVANRIRKGLQISNGGAIIGSQSALISVLNSSNQLNSANQSDMKNLKSVIGSSYPSPLKSRFVEKSEVALRVNDFQKAFLNLGVSLPNANIEHLGINCFMITIGYGSNNW